MSEPKFKIGDKVVCLERHPSGKDGIDWDKQADEIIGEELKICTSRDRDGDYKCERVSGTMQPMYFAEDWLSPFVPLTVDDIVKQAQSYIEHSLGIANTIGQRATFTFASTAPFKKFINVHEIVSYVYHCSILAEKTETLHHATLTAVINGMKLPTLKFKKPE